MKKHRVQQKIKMDKMKKVPVKIQNKKKLDLLNIPSESYRTTVKSDGDFSG